MNLKNIADEGERERDREKDRKDGRREMIVNSQFMANEYASKSPTKIIPMLIVYICVRAFNFLLIYDLMILH